MEGCKVSMHTQASCLVSLSLHYSSVSFVARLLFIHFLLAQTLVLRAGEQGKEGGRRSLLLHDHSVYCEAEYYTYVEETLFMRTQV